MTIVFKAVMLIVITISGLGMLSDKEPKKYQVAFGLAGILFLLSVFLSYICK